VDNKLSEERCDEEFYSEEERFNKEAMRKEGKGYIQRWMLGAV